jgi:hypothetical protein
MLLRLCYVDVEAFYRIGYEEKDLDKCHSLMNMGFKKGFKLRRKGHTGKHDHP